MNIFKNKYRIQVKSFFPASDLFLAQKKVWFFPFWFSVGIYHLSKERAENDIMIDKCYPKYSYIKV